MEKYEVKITDEALKDMEKIYDYIANSYAIARKTSVNSLFGTNTNPDTSRESHIPKDNKQ